MVSLGRSYSWYARRNANLRLGCTHRMPIARNRFAMTCAISTDYQVGLSK
jgi:hypothetical protein